MSDSTTCRRLVLALLAVFFLVIPVLAEDKPDADGAEKLLKDTQNPVASLISVPVQNNTNFNLGPANRTQDILNIQPVIPVGLSKDWNLIVRWITPVVWQPVPTQKNIGVYGLGDMVPTFFLSPAKPGALIWGIGPAFQLPTATNFDTGQGKFGVGLSIVLLTQPGHWTIGVLANNVWSVGGPKGRPRINQFLMQYFINYNLEKGWYLTTSPIVTANWRASKGNEWVAPVGGGVGRVCHLGPMPANITAQFYGNAVRPAGASPWGMRLQMAFLFPKRPR
jgi:hypothetical protein